MTQTEETKEFELPADAYAELEAADSVTHTRRARSRSSWITFALIVALVGAAAFFAGVKVQKGQKSAEASNPIASLARQFGGGGGGRGGGGATGGGGGRGGGIAGALGGATIGQVKVIDGNVLYVTDLQGNTVRITTSDTSKFTKNAEGSVNDVRPGDTVIVSGPKDPEGSVAASNVQIGIPGGFGGGLGGGGGGGGGSPFGGGGGR